MQIDLEILLNLPNIRVTDYAISESEAHIHCESLLLESRCPSCGETTKEVTMYQERCIRDMPLLGRTVYLHLRTRQFHCSDCGRYFNERFEFVETSKTLSKRYEEYLYKMVSNICVLQVAIKENVAWTTVEEIHKRYASKELGQRKVWSRVERIGIDEISVRKGMKNYACVLVDLDTGKVLDFLENRQKETIIEYFTAKGAEFCKQIKVISSDMWDAYSSLAGTLFPNAVSVIDRFHFFIHINKALDLTRKALRKAMPDELNFKHLRWTLLKNPDCLNEKEQELLDKAFSVSQELAKVYELRQKLKNIFDMDISKNFASEYLFEWETQARKIESKAMSAFLKTLTNWRDNILNFFFQRCTNAVVEGINNAIRGILRRSFGFHRFDNLKLRVMTELG